MRSPACSTYSPLHRHAGLQVGMFHRETPAKLGDYMRRGLEPMAQSLGIDYEESFFSPPLTDQARALHAYRCGQSLLMSFTYPDGWPNAFEGKRVARKAAKAFRAGLLTTRGQNAISHMTQGYAREMADLWRRTARASTTPREAMALQESAARSEALGELAARCWPVGDPFGRWNESRCTSRSVRSTLTIRTP